MRLLLSLVISMIIMGCTENSTTPYTSYTPMEYGRVISSRSTLLGKENIIQLKDRRITFTCDILADGDSVAVRYGLIGNQVAIIEGKK